jgi:hypothetical protein
MSGVRRFTQQILLKTLYANFHTHCENGCNGFFIDAIKIVVDNAGSSGYVPAIERVGRLGINPNGRSETMKNYEYITAAGIMSAVEMLQEHIEEAPNAETRDEVIKLGELLNRVAMQFGSTEKRLEITVRP